MQKAYLIKRLSWYYPLERFHAWVTFPVITVAVLIRHSISNSVFLVYGLLLIIFILFQGQHYWKLKLFRLTNRDFNQSNNLSLFGRLKKINAILIGFIPLAMLVQLYLWGWVIKSESLLIWGLLACLFGILEHINYYYRQLSIDNKADVDYFVRTRKFKVASLAKDLREGAF